MVCYGLHISRERAEIASEGNGLRAARKHDAAITVIPAEAGAHRAQGSSLAKICGGAIASLGKIRTDGSLGPGFRQPGR
jgi:hypothetical protein